MFSKYEWVGFNGALYYIYREQMKKVGESFSNTGSMKAKEATIQIVIDHFKKHPGVEAKVVSTNSNDVNEVKICIHVKNSFQKDTYLGTLTIDFDPTKISGQVPTSFSNSIVESFIKGWCFRERKQTLTDDDLAFVAQAEALQKVLQEKVTLASQEEKNLSHAINEFFGKMDTRRISYPEKTKMFTQILTIFNKIVNHQATSKDIDWLSQDSVSKEMIPEYSLIYRNLGIGLTFGSPVLLTIAVVIAATILSFPPTIILLLTFSVPLGIIGFVGGIFMWKNSEDNRNLRDRILDNAKSIQQKIPVAKEISDILCVENIPTETPVYGAEVLASSSTPVSKENTHKTSSTETSTLTQKN
jgi:hypothetical protein